MILLSELLQTKKWVLTQETGLLVYFTVMSEMLALSGHFDDL